jgi:hypothetical protein
MTGLGGIAEFENQNSLGDVIQEESSSAPGIHSSA